MKKIISLCLIVCLSLSLSPFSSGATAEEGGVAGGAPQRRVQQPLAERAEQIALEFYNYRCTAYEGGHFVEQTEENRANVIARVKRYFRNSKNFEHIKRLDTEHFANEVLCFRDISRLPDVQAELETFLKNQIVKLPEIEARPASAKWRIIAGWTVGVVVGAVAVWGLIALLKKSAQAAVEQDMDYQTAEVRRLTTDNAMLEGQLRDKTAAADDLRIASTQLMQTLTAQTWEERRLKADIIMLIAQTEEVEKLRVDKAKLEPALHWQTSEVKRLKHFENRLLRDMETKKKELETHRKTADLVETDLRTEANDLRARKEKAQKELETKTAELRAMTTAAEDLRTAKEAAEREAKRLREANAELERQLREKAAVAPSAPPASRKSPGRSEDETSD